VKRLSWNDVVSAKNIQWQVGHVTRAQREQTRNHRAGALWMTGLSGAGKTTLAYALERELWRLGVVTYVLDGDNVRHGLNADLGFSPEGRAENIRRIGEVVKLFADAGLLVLCAFVSPYRADRDRLRAAMPAGDFIEVYVKASLATCRGRDPKGLYQKSDRGEITDLTGVGAPYEAPANPEIVLETDAQSIDENIAATLAWLRAHAYLRV
jgi:adenylylsulfate kinase